MTRLAQDNWYYFVRWFFLLCLGFAVYFQTFGFGFVYDDREFIVNNPYIRGFDKLNGIWAILPKTRLIGIYSFALNCHLSHLNPWSYHVFNFMVHLLAAGLVWGLGSLLFRITGGQNRKADWLAQEAPFIIAVFFLVHPCQTQAVTYISQRFESMAAVFYLATVYCYLCARVSAEGPKKTILFVLSGVLAVWGILTKETAVTIPVMLLAAEWLLFPQAVQRRNLVILVLWIFFFAVVLMKLVHAGLNIFVQTFPSQSHDGDVITGGNYVLTQMRVFLTFCRLLVFPVNQNLDYDYPLSAGLLEPPLTLLGMSLIAAMVFLVFELRKSFPLIAFGLSWMLITFSINLAPRPNVIWEHKLYLISFGFFLATVVALFVLIRQRNILTGLLACLVVVMSVASFQRNQVWRNDLTLWEDVAKKSPGKLRVYANLGWAYGMAQMYDDAVYFLTKAVALEPDYYKNYMNLGDVYYLTGNNAQALKNFNKAIELKPLNFGLYIKRAKVYKNQKNYEAALTDLGRSISLRPNLEGYMERGMLWMQQQHPEQALEDMQQALKLEPGNFDALINRAGVYFCTGRYELAIKDLNQAQTIDATDFKVYKNRAYCYLAMGKNKEALKDIEASLRLNPVDVQMYSKYQEISQLK
jgi:Flp pilus assembly protein TadD